VGLPEPEKPENISVSWSRSPVEVEEGVTQTSWLRPQLGPPTSLQREEKRQDLEEKKEIRVRCFLPCFRDKDRSWVAVGLNLSSTP
jgi:hypothetical protein